MKMETESGIKTAIIRPTAAGCHLASSFCGSVAEDMAKSKNESNNKNSGTLLTEKDGTQYFVMGKVRIKVSEHFAQDGKPLDSLLEDVIQHAAAAS